MLYVQHHGVYKGRYSSVSCQVIVLPYGLLISAAYVTLVVSYKYITNQTWTDHCTTSFEMLGSPRGNTGIITKLCNNNVYIHGMQK